MGVVGSCSRLLARVKGALRFGFEQKGGERWVVRGWVGSTLQRWTLVCHSIGIVFCSACSTCSVTLPFRPLSLLAPSWCEITVGKLSFKPTVYVAMDCTSHMSCTVFISISLHYTHDTHLRRCDSAELSCMHGTEILCVCVRARSQTRVGNSLHIAAYHGHISKWRWLIVRQRPPWW